MYSYEQRLEAVRLVMADGLSQEAAAKLLGYPKSPGTIGAWVGEVRSSGRLHKSYGARGEAPRVGLEATAVKRTDTSGMDLDALEMRKAELEREIRELELRKAVIEKTAELLGKGLGGDPENVLSNREKAVLVRDLEARGMRQCDLLRAVGLPRSTYNGQLAAMGRPDKHARLRELVAGVFDASGGTYGRRRVSDALKVAGTAVGERLAARLMREEGLVARNPGARKRGWSSYAGEVSEHPGNRVGRCFRAGLPNFLWLTDVTQFKIPSGRVYLSPIMDCFDGAIVSWAVSTSPDAEMANSMLRGALAGLAAEERRGLVIHSDCGCHYRWPGWISICDEAGVTRSMSSKGCSPDNAAMEGFFGRLKTEMFYDRDWSGVGVEEFARELDGYIRWYNERRIKRSLGGMSPLQYRRSLGLVA